MQKRRERIEQWRAERKKNQEIVQLTVLPPSKKWSLEDDDDEEDDPAPSGNKEGNDDDELDPLDAYMNEVNETVKKTKETDAVAGKNQVPLLCSFLVSPPLKIKRIIFSLPVLYACLAFFQFQKFLQISKNQDQNVFWDIPSTFDLWILPLHPQLADFAGFGIYTSEASKSYQELMV